MCSKLAWMRGSRGVFLASLACGAALLAPTAVLAQEVAEALNPGYHYVRVRIVDSGRPTTGSVESRQPDFHSVVTIKANSGFKKVYWSSAPNQRLRVTAHYRGKSATKIAYSAWPPADLTFRYSNGRLE